MLELFEAVWVKDSLVLGVTPRPEFIPFFDLVYPGCQTSLQTGGPDGDSTGKFVVYLLATLLPDWQPPTTLRHRTVPSEMLPVLREAAANGQSLRTLARGLAFPMRAYGWP